MRVAYGVRSRDPLVSILINNYNYGRYLGAAIDSALAQTYPSVQIVVGDDGSTDESEQVIAGYGDRIEAVRMSNGGQSACVGRALERVRGDVTLILDADDTLAPDVVERAVAAFAADPACVRVQFRLRVTDGAGTPVGRLVPPAQHPLMTGDLSPFVMRHRVFRYPPMSGNAWSTAALRRIFPAPDDPLFRMSTDRYIAELTAYLGTVRALDDPGGTYRVHGGNGAAGKKSESGYFSRRVRLTTTLHELGRPLAEEAGLTGYPATVDDLLDPTLPSWELVCHKLGDPVVGARRSWVRGIRALAVVPGLSWRTRVARGAWLTLLAATPAGTPLAARVVRSRYQRGEF
jgi:hypothetical protein